MSEIPKEFRDRVKKLHADGYTIREIAKQTNTLPKVITNIIEHPFSFTKEQMEIALRALHNQEVDYGI